MSRLRIVVDFDSTITQNDTLEHLAAIAYGPRNATSKSERNQASRSWANVVDAYTQDYQTHTAAYIPRKEDRTTIEQEAAWLASLRGIEKASFKRVEQDGLFAQITKDDVATAAREAVRDGRVAFRRGWAEFFDRAHRHLPGISATLEVLSVNWSREWIRNCLQSAAEAEGNDRVGRLFDDTATEDGTIPVEIHANEICGFQNTTEMKILTSGDKLQNLMRGVKLLGLESTASRPVIIYIGDSITDIECILAANVGVIMKESAGALQGQLLETLERYVQVCDLATFDAEDVSRAFKSGRNGDQDSEPISYRRLRVWWIEDFRNLALWLAEWGSVISSLINQSIFM